MASMDAFYTSTATDWLPLALVRDEATAGTFTSAAWEGFSPQSYYEDSNCVKGVYFTNLPTTNRHPLIYQRQAARLSVRFATTYNGMAEVRIVSPGDSPGHIGRKQAPHSYDANVDVVSNGDSKVREEYRGHIHSIFQSNGSESAAALAARAGAVHVVPGNKSTSFHMDSCPDYSWARWGQLDATDAPDNSFTSVGHNFHPRNYRREMSQGFVLITNHAATDDLVVYFSSKALFSVILQGDDTTRGISALAGTMRLSAPTVEFHPPPRRDPYAFEPTILADTGPSHRIAMERRHGTAIGSAHDERPPAHASPDHTGGSGGFMATLGNIASGIGRAGKWLVEKTLQNAPQIARAIMTARSGGGMSGAARTITSIAGNRALNNLAIQANPSWSSRVEEVD